MWCYLLLTTSQRVPGYELHPRGCLTTSHIAEGAWLQATSQRVPDYKPQQDLWRFHISLACLIHSWKYMCFSNCCQRTWNEVLHYKYVDRIHVKLVSRYYTSSCIHIQKLHVCNEVLHYNHVIITCLQWSTLLQVCKRFMCVMKYRITTVKQVKLICNAVCSLQNTKQHKFICSKFITNKKRTICLRSVFKCLYIKFCIVTT